MNLKTRMALCAAAALVSAAGANAGVAYFNGALTANSPTFVNPGGSGIGSASGHYYSVMQFTVDVSGNYTFESASPNTNTANPSNALDTNIRIYANAFNPATPASPAASGSNDDFTGTLTVLPGPYAPTITSAATGFTGAQPSSRIASLALVAGTNYFFVNSSYRRIDYVSTSNEGQATGAFYSGISGPGNITLVPSPSSMALLGLGGLLAARRRRA
jgi:hypothetical protein